MRAPKEHDPFHRRRARALASACIACARSHAGGTYLEAGPIMNKPVRRSWWTWKLGEIAGIAIRVHVTLVLLLAWIALTYMISGADVRVAAIGLLLVCAVFAVILVH